MSCHEPVRRARCDHHNRPEPPETLTPDEAETERLERVLVEIQRWAFDGMRHPEHRREALSEIQLWTIEGMRRRNRLDLDEEAEQ